ncbi:MAG: FAD-binding protein [Thauera phenolivorans]|uniref:FAD-binding protein n=1 Tax=Thauera phenolivorans TaxID=1792543 RepID=A0A7X7RA20_9RHOO|nr:FAD-binding protein [Thauera phenolivorans]
MQRSTGNVTARHIPPLGTLSASSPAEVQDIVRRARSEGFALYPISTGLNWGYGSHSPTSKNAWLLDLGAMNGILNADEISLDNPVAVIEPGVTQGQLHDFLQAHCPELGFNVTGAGRDTSIIGNALDRGVGYFGPRKDDLFGLEVVAGTGQMLRTGFRRLGEDSPLAHSHPFGLGPMLDGLFFQGNFGIVTSACFRLRPKRPCERAVSLALRRREDLPAFIDVLARLKREGLLTSVTHIGNRERTHATLSYGITHYLETECGMDGAAARAEAARAMKIVAPHEWTSLASVSGNAGQVRAAIREIRKRTRAIARLMVVSDGLLDFGYAVTHRLRFLPFARANAAAIAAMRPLHALALGVPTDIAIQNLLWKFDHPNDRAIELDDSRCGLLFICPALPLNGRLATEVVEGMDEVAARHGHTLYTTLNIETETSLVAVINLLFDRGEAEEIERAHACADELLTYIRSRGLEPYRARADMMDRIVAGDPAYWSQIRALKKVLDPDGIIAPGRYSLAG